jgi:hypothetical protein
MTTSKNITLPAGSSSLPRPRKTTLCSSVLPTFHFPFFLQPVDCKIMMSIRSLALAIVAITTCMQCVIAFAPAAVRSSSTALNLVPKQGPQLVAYSQAVLAKKAKESASKASNLTSDRRRSATKEGSLAKARNLMTRLLHLPGNADVNPRVDEDEPSQ